MEAPADAKQSRILKELRKLCFDHPGPVTAANFFKKDVKGKGGAFAPLPTQGGRPAARNKRKELFDRASNAACSLLLQNLNGFNGMQTQV